MKKKMTKALIVGGDSRLGVAMQQYSLKNNYEWLFTTRRVTGEQSFIFYDLLKSDPKSLTEIDSIQYYIILAGITDYRLCENDPHETQKTNVKAICSLAERLISRGKKVIFISTNTVLGEGDRTCEGKYNPLLHYSKQKAEVEKRILLFNEIRNSVKVIRLTKHVSTDTSPFGQWIKDLRADKTIRAFTDLYFSPITFMHSAEFIDKVINLSWEATPSILHLSGAKDLNYYEFALALADRLNKGSSQVHAITSEEAGVKLLYRSNVTYLDMRSTSSAVGYKPVSIERVLDNLI
tara:strand:+ start:696 stop:1574 length:879 start_codon:yes stop_codon:yes gene_type:complete